MTFVGPISSVFDFLTFGVMLWVFHARASLFQTGWFVESLATQVLVIFIIRTRSVPFFHSRPGRPLLLTSLACVILAVLVLIYLGLVELGKSLFFRVEGHRRPSRPVALQLD
jgi:P-type Mg2+ transporter